MSTTILSLLAASLSSNSSGECTCGGEKVGGRRAERQLARRWVAGSGVTRRAAGGRGWLWGLGSSASEPGQGQRDLWGGGTGCGSSGGSAARQRGCRRRRRAAAARFTHRHHGGAQLLVAGGVQVGLLHQGLAGEARYRAWGCCTGPAHRGRHGGQALQAAGGPGRQAAARGQGVRQRALHSGVLDRRLGGRQAAGGAGRVEGMRGVRRCGDGWQRPLSSQHLHPSNARPQQEA